jgi:hypothetical protein
MERHLNKSVSSTKEILGIFKFYKTTTEQGLLENKNDSYLVDRLDASGYFGVMPKWENKIRSYLSGIKKSRQKVVHLDICGRASGISLLADKSYCFSLLTSDFSKSLSSEKRILVDGDLFNQEDFSKFISIVKKGRVAPAFVTFMPMAGLHNYNPFFNSESNKFPNYEEVTYGLLGKRLKSIVKILRPGGYILLEKPFQGIGMGDFILGKPQDKSEFSLLVKSFARKIKCSVEVHSAIGGPYFLLRKSLK